MDRESLRRYCLSKPGAFEDFPFGPGVAVYKVKGRMFALLPVESHPPSISLKCDPQLALMLRETYPAVTAGYHLNKRLWNSIRVDGSVPDDEVFEMIDNSFAEVISHLPKKDRESLL